MAPVALMIIGDFVPRLSIFRAFRDSEHQENPRFDPVHLVNDIYKNVDVDSTGASAPDNKFDLHHAGPKCDKHINKGILNPAFTVLVCIDSDNYEAYKEQIENIKNMRAKIGIVYFNILPVCSNKDSCQNTLFQLKKDYPGLCKEAVEVNFEADNFSPLLKTSLDVSWSGPIYVKIITTINYLTKLKNNLNEKNINNLDSTLHDLLKFLIEGMEKRGCKNENNSLKNYFDKNKEQITQSLLELHKNLQNHIKYENRTKNIFLNIICSIEIIFIMLSIVGIPVALLLLEKNLKKHNHSFKFYAINQADEVQEHLNELDENINLFSLKN